MKRLILFVLALTGPVLSRLHADDAATIAEVKVADDARVAAMVAPDPAQLEAILSDELHYAHSAKLIENKAEHIASLTSRRLIYQKINFETRDFRVVAPGVVLSKGRALVEVGSSRQIFLVDINFLGVWRLENQHWRLYAWQSSRNAEIVPIGSSSENRPNQAAGLPPRFKI